MCCLQNVWSSSTLWFLSQPAGRSYELKMVAKNLFLFNELLDLIVELIRINTLL
jgi:hypothetical protein